MKFYVKFLLFPHFSLFLVFNHDLVININFIHVAASNTATDDVTKYITHRIFNKKLITFFSSRYTQN